MNSFDFHRLKPLRKYLNFIFVAISLIPILIVANNIRTKAINLPFWDEWDQSVPIALDTVQGELQFTDLFDQHNEHRTLTANIFTAILTRVTNWDIRVNSYISFIVVLCSFLLVGDLFKRFWKDRLLFVIIPFSSLLFSTRQISNWLWGFQIQWFFISFYLIAALWLLKVVKVGWKPLCVAASLAFLATFSLSSGLLFWPLLGVAIWFLGYKRIQYFVFWIIISMISLISFFYGFDFSFIGQNDVGRFILSPTILGRYLFTFLGGPFVVVNPDLSFWIGIFGLGILIANILLFIRRERRIEPIAIWIALAGYSVGSGFLAAVGRSKLFLTFGAQPLSSRYVTMSTPFWLAFIAVIAIVGINSFGRVRRSKGEIAIRGINILALILLGGFYIRANQQMASVPWFLNKSHENCVRSYPIFLQDQCLEGLYPDSRLITEKILQLSRYDLSVFADSSRNEIQPLNLVPLNFVGAQVSTHFRSYEIDGEEVSVLFQHSPSIVEQQIMVPKSELFVSFQTAIYVETDNFIENPEIPQDGVEFLFQVVTDDGLHHLMFKEVFDPRKDHMPKSIFVDLVEFKGQHITLVFETLERENSYYDWSMWVDTRIIIGEHQD